MNVSVLQSISLRQHELIKESGYCAEKIRNTEGMSVSSRCPVIHIQYLYYEARLIDSTFHRHSVRSLGQIRHTYSNLILLCSLLKFFCSVYFAILNGFLIIYRSESHVYVRVRVYVRVCVPHAG